MNIHVDKIKEDVLILRLFKDGIEPIWPNKFEFAVVAVLEGKVAKLKALCYGVTRDCRETMAIELRKHGIREVVWDHNGKEKRLMI